MPFPLVLLSFSPGGITEMTLCALSLGMDASFVAMHHTLRILAITTVAPLAFRLLGEQAGRGGERKEGGREETTVGEISAAGEVGGGGVGRAEIRGGDAASSREQRGEKEERWKQD